MRAALLTIKLATSHREVRPRKEKAIIIPVNLNFYSLTR